MAKKLSPDASAPYYTDPLGSQIPALQKKTQNLDANGKIGGANVLYDGNETVNQSIAALKGKTANLSNDGKIGSDNVMVGGQNLTSEMIAIGETFEQIQNALDETIAAVEYMNTDIWAGTAFNADMGAFIQDLNVTIKPDGTLFVRTVRRDTDGSWSVSLAKSVDEVVTEILIFDESGYAEPDLVDGKKLAILTLSGTNGYSGSATMLVDWNALYIENYDYTYADEYQDTDFSDLVYANTVEGQSIVDLGKELNQRASDIEDNIDLIEENIGIIEGNITTLQGKTQNITATAGTTVVQGAIQVKNSSNVVNEQITAEGFYQTRYRDLFPSSVWETPAGGAAPDNVAVTIGGISFNFKAFDGGTTAESMSNSFEIDHWINTIALNAETLKAEIHTHGLASTNTAGTVKIFFDLVYFPYSQTPVAPILWGTFSTTITIALNQQHYHVVGMYELAKPSSGFNIGDIIKVNYRRDPTQDTYPDDWLFMQCAFHMPDDGRGSRQRYIK